MARNNVLDKDLITQCMNVTGTEESVAKNMLEAFNGNLELAINMYLEGAPSLANFIQDTSHDTKKLSKKRTQETSTATISASTITNQSKTEAKESDDDDVRAPIPQQQAVLAEDKYHALPYYQHRRQQPTSSVFDSCRDFKKETEEYTETLLNKTSRGKKKRLHELFRPPVDILYDGDFQSARDTSQRKNKWLLINIQNSLEFPCQVLNRDVWANKIVREILTENFILWQQAHNSDAGLHFSTFYPVSNCPHLSIIDPRTGERMRIWENLGMKPTAEQFAELATTFLSEHPHLNHSFEEGRKKETINSKSSIIDRDEDEQLNAAIKASLHETSTTESIALTDSDHGSDALFSDDDGDDGQPESKKRKKDSSVKTCNATSEEVTTTNISPIENRIPVDSTLNENSNMSDASSRSDEGDSEKVRILLRLPDNERKQIILHFSNTLKELSEHVTSLGWSSKKYELIKAFPRQNMSKLDDELTLKEAGLHKQETLFLQDR